MRTVMVVVMNPVLRGGANLSQGVKDIAIEDAMTVGAIEPFDVRVLRRPPFQDELQNDVSVGRPFSQLVANEFWPVVQANSVGLAAHFHQLIERTDHARRSLQSQFGIHFLESGIFRLQLAHLGQLPDFPASVLALSLAITDC